MIKRIIFVLILFFSSLALYGQYSAPPVMRLAPIDLQGGGLWNWEQRLSVTFDNYVVNGDMTYWPNGTSSPPYGWETSGIYGPNSCSVTREATNYKLGQYSARITSNGSNGYTDYILSFRKEWKDRPISLGFWYFCPRTNDKEQKVELIDDTRNSYIVLSKDGAWHWGHIVFYVDNEATLLHVRFVVNNSGTADTNDYMLIDGLTVQEGRISTRWCYSYWDMLYRYGFYYDGTDYGLKMTPTSGYLLSLYGGLYLSKTAPVLAFRESDQTLPDGLWRFAADAKWFRLDRNTAAAGDFSTYHGDIMVDSTGKTKLSLSSDIPTSPVAGDIRYKQGASGAPDTLLIYINAKWQKFVGTVNNP